MDRIEISPASVAQVHRTRVGGNIQIDDDVQGIAKELHEIDASLCLEFDPDEDLYIVYQAVAEPDGSTSEKLVTTWPLDRNGPLDKRLVHRIRQIASEGYDYVAELDRIDAEAKAREEYEFAERMGPAAEKLAWALLKDLGEGQSRAFISGGR